MGLSSLKAKREVEQRLLFGHANHQTHLLCQVQKESLTVSARV